MAEKALKIGLTLQKGGTGKTTTAASLSEAIARKGYRVLVVDCDPQANTSTWMKYNTDKGLYHILTSESVDDYPVQDEILQVRPGLDLLPSGTGMRAAELTLTGYQGFEHYLRLVLEQVDENYDFIFMDAPPNLGVLTTNIFGAADSILIPCEMSHMALEGVANLLRTYKLVKKTLNPRVTINGLIATKYDKRTNVSKDTLTDLKSAFGDLVYKTIVRENVTLKDASKAGKAIFDYAPKSNGALDYDALADEFLSRMNGGGAQNAA